MDLNMWLVSLWGKPPPPSSMPAMYTSPVARVTGDLHVADEGAGVDHCYRGCSKWRRCQWSSVTKQGAAADIEVVPGNVHVPEDGRAGVVVGPARLPVVAAVGVNAEMGPASRVRGSGGLVPAQALQPPHSASSQTVNQVLVGLLYRITGSPKVLAKGL